MGAMVRRRDLLLSRSGLTKSLCGSDNSVSVEEQLRFDIRIQILLLLISYGQEYEARHMRSLDAVG